MLKSKSDAGPGLNPLTSTLLADEEREDSIERDRSGTIRGRRVTNAADKHKLDMCQAYANNQPKIMLETINARTITVSVPVTFP